MNNNTTNNHSNVHGVCVWELLIQRTISNALFPATILNFLDMEMVQDQKLWCGISLHPSFTLPICLHPWLGRTLILQCQGCLTPQKPNGLMNVPMYVHATLTKQWLSIISYFIRESFIVFFIKNKYKPSPWCYHISFHPETDGMCEQLVSSSGILFNELTLGGWDRQHLLCHPLPVLVSFL